MIAYLSVDLKRLRSLGKDYPWLRPGCCPRCRSQTVWGHGYVDRYFEGEECFLPMKRWRCPDCGAVITMRPAGYWRRFLAPLETILESLRRKAETDRWTAEASRQRQQYWWRGFQRQSHFEGEPVSLAVLLTKCVIAATHSLTYREIRSVRHLPNLTLAVTPPLGVP